MATGSRTDGETEEPQLSADADVYLRRLEKLVRFLLGGRYESASKLWRLQTDLLSLQQDVQGEITALKATDRDADTHERLNEFRDVRAQARRFGDAVVWVLLGLDRQIIVPLADNDQVSVPVDDHGTRGVLVFAEAMAEEGWGFPVLHDISDCLRIGDVTFVRPGEAPLTVEVKTRPRGEQRTGSTVTYTYNILALSAGPLPTMDGGKDPEQAEAVSPPPPPDAMTEDRRVRRQVDRLIKVKARQDAESDDVVEIPGEGPMLSKPLDASGMSRWPVLRRVARKARRCGYAAETVDEAFVFVGLYDGDGLSIERLGTTLDELVTHVADSRIISTDYGRRNAVWLNSIPEPPARTAARYLPYFLYSLPKATILDLLHGRMVLFHLSNPARIAAAIEEAGFVVQPRHGDDFGTGFDVRTEIEGADGERLWVRLGGLENSMREMIMEFYSVEFIVGVAERMRDGAIDAAPLALDAIAQAAS